jgi:hypothetical protein
VGGRVGRNSNRYCLGYSLRAGLVFTKTPDHCVPNFGHKKAVMFGLRLARLKEFLRSTHELTLGGLRVNRRIIAQCGSSHSTRRAKTRARDGRR